MKLEELKTIEQLSQFLVGTQPVLFQMNSIKKERYDWIRCEFARFDYMQLRKKDKRVVIRYLIKVSGCSRQQVTQLIWQYRKTGHINYQHANAPYFQRKDNKDDIRLIARMDEQYDTPCEPALKKLCERACRVFEPLKTQ